MTILIAADSFKEALSAKEACQAIARGGHLAIPEASIELFPMADGGEGTAEVLTQNTGGNWLETTVMDPLFRQIKAGYGLTPDGKIAFIDMAQASGLSHLSEDEKNPLKTTTFGTGELLLHAVRRGAKRIVLGIGGSATNDAGIGMAQALGYRFFDKNNSLLPPIGESLIHIHRIDDAGLLLAPKEIEVEVLCDVDNPLYGPEGAAHIYAAQKGADANAIAHLDAGLQHFAQLFPQHHFGQMPGAGASGGLGAGTIAFLSAKLKPGIETIMEITDFEQHIKPAALILTGEGKLDEQSLRGKLIGGICRKAENYQVPVIALCGSLQATAQSIKEIGLCAAFSISQGPQTLQQAIAQTSDQLTQTAFQVLRTFKK